METQPQASWFHPKALVGAAFLVPPLLAWFMGILQLLGFKLCTLLPDRISPAAEVAILLVCPLLAVVTSGWAWWEIHRRGEGGERLCQVVLGTGLLLIVVVLLATLRDS